MGLTDPAPDLELVILDRIKLQASFLFPPDTQYRVTRDEMLDLTVHSIVSNFAGKTEVQTYTVPEDWWQHFKERWFPKRLLARFPVRYKSLSFEAHAVFPKIDLRNQRVILYEEPVVK